MNDIFIRLVCGVLVAVMGLGMVAHPPTNTMQVVGMLLPVSMLLSVAIRGLPWRRSSFPRKRVPPPPPDAGG
ncbi:hypothetical protein DRW03_21065 [Corallococcus sp. H22C18031201]|uniref:hypothetical protein n=1 Tax=Citreicoccus inhibens TaxID=2849499 RepID=UPI000E74B4DD|nr:hypothetical protein [Citreicoccus inhibens]MBU8895828.1 hypothetical protein [Citreicoccus inhibens]RJS20236.1 hypothetical protein DRW03_21065 [Corallococcus sp. H22C18031201]